MKKHESNDDGKRYLRTGHNGRPWLSHPCAWLFRLITDRFLFTIVTQVGVFVAQMYIFQILNMGFNTMDHWMSALWKRMYFIVLPWKIPVHLVMKHMQLHLCLSSSLVHQYGDSFPCIHMDLFVNYIIHRAVDIWPLYVCKFEQKNTLEQKRKKHLN